MVESEETQMTQAKDGTSTCPPGSETYPLGSERPPPEKNFNLQKTLRHLNENIGTMAELLQTMVKQSKGKTKSKKQKRSSSSHSESDGSTESSSEDVRGDSTLIRRVCATGVLNLSPSSGVGKPKKDTLLWSYHSFHKSIVLYCIVLCCVVLCCVVLCCVVFSCLVLSCLVLSCLVLSCLVLSCLVLYCIVLYCIVLYCIVLYCIVSYCIYYLLTGCKGRTRKYKPKVFHTA